MNPTKIMPDEIINTINDALPFEKCFTGGVLPIELFDKIYTNAKEIERREAEEHRLWCEEKCEECYECGCEMTRQQAHHSEQNCLDELENINEFADTTDSHFCGVECREISFGNARECECCGDAIHDDPNFWGNIFCRHYECEDPAKFTESGYREENVCRECGDDLWYELVGLEDALEFKWK
jgi:hypothetical protein